MSALSPHRRAKLGRHGQERCSPDTPSCPAGYQEAVTNKANPYGCNFDAINAGIPWQAA